ncbi:Uncharacterised protein [Mycobacteroides abscessus subsp. abscessus]|nr:Uncharacterised protein [Mycobacteroides abscessus subsp. abscessus]
MFCIRIGGNDCIKLFLQLNIMHLKSFFFFRKLGCPLLEIIWNTCEKI